MEIRFYWYGSFAGIYYYMIVNNIRIEIGVLDSTEDEAKLEAIKKLKEIYNIDFNIDDINFEWNGCL